MKTKKNVLKTTLALAFVLISVFTFAQVDTTTTRQMAIESTKTTIGDIIRMIIVSAGALFMIGHMSYVLFKSKRFAQNYSIAGFKALRQIAGKAETSTEEENSQCIDLLNEAFHTWSKVEVENGNEYRKPKRMKEILKSALYLQQVIEIEPTDGEIIDTLNEYKEVVHSNEKRSFDGSIPLIVLGLIFAIVVGLFTKSEETGFILSTLKYGAFFWVPVIVYYISSLTPEFLIEKRANRGGGNVSTGLIAFAIGILGSGFTMRTRFTDGSHEDDHTGHYIAWILGIAALLAVAITIFFWSIVNYVRNYLLFF